MSVLVAVRKAGVAAIVADTQVSQGAILIPGEMRLSPPKIHRIANGYMGIVGSMAHHRVIRSLSAARPELFNFESGDEVFETLRRIYPLVRDEYFSLTGRNDEDEEYESGQMHGLIISKQGVFSFSDSRDVSEHRSFWAAGSGMEFAIGALESLYTSDMSAPALAESAANVACKFDKACGLPLESHHLEL